MWVKTWFISFIKGVWGGWTSVRCAKYTKYILISWGCTANSKSDLNTLAWNPTDLLNFWSVYVYFVCIVRTVEVCNSWFLNVQDFIPIQDSQTWYLWELCKLWDREIRSCLVFYTHFDIFIGSHLLAACWLCGQISNLCFI